MLVSARIIAEKRGAGNKSIHRLRRRYVKNLCNLRMDLLCASFAFELAALEETDQLTAFSDDCNRTDAISFHQFLRVIESRVWFDEKPRRDGPHDVAGVCEVPTFAWQRLEIFQRQHAVKAVVLSHWESNLPVQRQNRVDQVTDK